MKENIVFLNIVKRRTAYLKNEQYFIKKNIYISNKTILNHLLLECFFNKKHVSYKHKKSVFIMFPTLGFFDL